MSGDKTSRDKTSEGKNEGVEGQNVQWDKTSRGTKLPADKTSMGKKNIRRHIIRGTKHPHG
jgi:hypothetical protein